MDRISIILYNRHRAINKAVAGGFDMKHKHKAERSARPGIQGLGLDLGTGKWEQMSIRQQTGGGTRRRNKRRGELSARAPFFTFLCGLDRLRWLSRDLTKAHLVKL